MSENTENQKEVPEEKIFNFRQEALFAQNGATFSPGGV